jgi:hypothetical protein
MNFGILSSDVDQNHLSTSRCCREEYPPISSKQESATSGHFRIDFNICWTVGQILTAVQPPPAFFHPKTMGRPARFNLAHRSRIDCGSMLSGRLSNFVDNRQAPS